MTSVLRGPNSNKSDAHEVMVQSIRDRIPSCSIHTARNFATYQLSSYPERIQVVRWFQKEASPLEQILWHKVEEYMGGDSMLGNSEREWVCQLMQIGDQDAMRSIIESEFRSLLLRTHIFQSRNLGIREFSNAKEDHTTHLLVLESSILEKQVNLSCNTQACSVIDLSGGVYREKNIDNLRVRLSALIRRLSSSTQAFPWLGTETSLKVNPKGGLVCAGGALTSLLHNIEPKDWDLFIVAPDDVNAIYIILQAMDCFTKLAKEEGKNLTISTKGFVINFTLHTIMTDENNRKYRSDKEVFQIILRRFTRAEDVIVGFDIEACALMYLGNGHVFCTENAALAFQSNMILYNPTRLSTTSEQRYLKYAEKFGFRILYVGLPQVILDNIYDEASKVTKRLTNSRIFRTPNPFAKVKDEDKNYKGLLQGGLYIKTIENGGFTYYHGEKYLDDIELLILDFIDDFQRRNPTYLGSEDGEIPFEISVFLKLLCNVFLKDKYCMNIPTSKTADNLFIPCGTKYQLPTFALKTADKYLKRLMKRSIVGNEWIKGTRRNINILDMFYDTFAIFAAREAGLYQETTTEESDYMNTEFDYIEFINVKSLTHYKDYQLKLSIRLNSIFTEVESREKTLSGSFNPRKQTPISITQIKLASLRVFGE